MIWTDETRAIAAGMRRAGMTTQQIADRLGTTRSVVQHAQRRSGAKRKLNGHGGGNKHMQWNAGAKHPTCEEGTLPGNIEEL